MTQPITKNKISLINSLTKKKYRQYHGFFVAEGFKIISEIVDSSLKVEYLIKDENELFDYDDDNCEIFTAKESDLKKISNLKTPSSLIAVVKMPKVELDISSLKNKLSIAIDEIQDPGNLGTIIRICDWFGIENIICSDKSVDVFNSKVIQATMGAFLRVNVHYVNLEEFIPEYIKETGNECFGTFLDGDNIYQTELTENGLFVLGNEGKGISEEIEDLIDRRLFIPPYNNKGLHSESLNIASAASIVCSEFRRKFL